MPTIHEKLDVLIAKVRRLPEPRLVAAIEALQEIADEPYELSADELAILRPALDEALSSKHLTDAENDDLLNKPWG